MIYEDGNVFMELSEQVIPYEIAKRVKELGVNADSIFYWIRNAGNPLSIYFLSMGSGFSKEYHKYDSLHAYTVSELMELLPKTINSSYELVIKKLSNKYLVLCALKWIDEDLSVHINFSDEDNIEFMDEKLSDCCAKMLIHLLENGLMKSEDMQ